MSGAIGPGDLLEALHSESGFGVTVTAGTIYRCYAVSDMVADYPCTDCGGDEGFLVLHGFPTDIGFCPCAFKPISGGERGMFDHMLKAPTDAPNKEPVAA